jgi:hypothetical protein
MSIAYLPVTQPAPTHANRVSTTADDVSTNAAGTEPTSEVAAARPRRSAGRLFLRAVVVLIAAAVGFVIAVFIGVATGLLPIGC